MNRFKICPRCDKKFFFSRRICDCSFISFHPNTYSGIIKQIKYQFNTEKYKIVVYERLLAFRGTPATLTCLEDEWESYIFTFCDEKIKTIRRKILPKADNFDVEKYLMLL